MPVEKKTKPTPKKSKQTTFKKIVIYLTNQLLMKPMYTNLRYIFCETAKKFIVFRYIFHYSKDKFIEYYIIFMFDLIPFKQNIYINKNYE